MAVWRRIEHPEVLPVRLSRDDKCFYAREYLSHGGWKASEANALITNLKKPVARKGMPDWKYKVSAVNQFATELTKIVNGGPVVAVPSSKRRDDPEYDPRLDVVLKKLAKLDDRVVVEEPFEIVESHQAVHAGGTRGVDEFYDLLEWRGFQESPEFVVLVDDVITTGAHFKACQRMILDHHPGIETFGVFWAKVIWPEEQIEEFEGPFF